MSEETELVVRCEIDGVLKHKGQDELLSVKALNEFDPKLTGQCHPPQHCNPLRLPSLATCCCAAPFVETPSGNTGIILYTMMCASSCLVDGGREERGGGNMVSLLDCSRGDEALHLHSLRRLRCLHRLSLILSKTQKNCQATSIRPTNIRL